MTTVYKYNKDKSITIEKEIVNNKGKEQTKYTATKEGKIAKGFPSEESAVSFLNRNFVNSKKSEVNNSNNKQKLNLKEMEKSLAELEQRLATLEKGLTKDEIQENAVLKKSLNGKINALKGQIKRLKGEEPKVEKPKVEKEPKKSEPKVVAPKVEKPKTEKKPAEAPKVKETKNGIVVNGFAEGDEVTYIDKETGKTIKGVIAKLAKCSGSDDYDVFVKVGDKKQKMRLKKVSKA